MMQIHFYKTEKQENKETATYFEHNNNSAMHITHADRIVIQIKIKIIIYFQYECNLSIIEKVLNIMP